MPIEKIKHNSRINRLTWSLGVFYGSGENIFSNDFIYTSQSKVFRPRHSVLRQSQEHTYADPFLFVDNNCLYLFCEVQKRSEVGHINVFYTHDLKSWNKATVLKEPFHLSFPFVFKYNGKIYLIPESFHNNEIALYEFEKFPYKVKRVKQLQQGKYSDTVFYQQNDTCYLFTTNEKNELILFYSNDLLGTWKQHPKNPVSTGKSTSRNGGAVFMYKNKLYRISQDFSRYYGEKTNLLEITALSETEYTEIVRSNNLVPKTFAWNHLGTHHFTYAHFKGKNVVAVDGLSSLRDLKKLLRPASRFKTESVPESESHTIKTNEAPSLINDFINARNVSASRLNYAEIDINNPEIYAQTTSLLKEAFKINALPDKKLLLNTCTDSKLSPSVYIGAFDKGRLVGFNAFMSHDIVYNNAVVNCFQSCWIATAATHRGKGIFSSIIKHSLEILKGKDAGFIFSFPNDVSGPIFLRKLGFKEYPSVKLNIPALPQLAKFRFSGKTDSFENMNAGAFLQNNTQLINLKKKEYDNEIVVFETDGNLIWGKIRLRKIGGLLFRYFDTGGLEIRNSKEVRNIFLKLNQIYKVAFVQIISTKNNKQNILFSNFSSPRTNNLIVYDLNIKTGPDSCFNFYSGIKDVF